MSHIVVGCEFIEPLGLHLFDTGFVNADFGILNFLANGDLLVTFTKGTISIGLTALADEGNVFCKMDIINVVVRIVGVFVGELAVAWTWRNAFADGIEGICSVLILEEIAKIQVIVNDSLSRMAVEGVTYTCDLNLALTPTVHGTIRIEVEQ